jgi:hypothetical protein
VRADWAVPGQFCTTTHRELAPTRKPTPKREACYHDTRILRAGFPGSEAVFAKRSDSLSRVGFSRETGAASKPGFALQRLNEWAVGGRHP